MTQKRKKAEQLPLVFHQLFDAIANKASDFTIKMLVAQLSVAQNKRFVEMMQFKKAAFARAVELGPQVWENWDFAKEGFQWSLIEPSGDVYAMVVMPREKTWASGRKLLQRASYCTLSVSFRAMELTPAQLDKILLHELVHMGYSGHNAAFIKVCHEVGGAISGSGVHDPGLHIEKKVGHRYQRVHTIEMSETAEKEAQAWVRAEQQAMQARGEPPAKWALSYG